MDTAIAELYTWAGPTELTEKRRRYCQLCHHPLRVGQKYMTMKVEPSKGSPAFFFKHYGECPNVEETI